jgi:hypothetical protein
MARAISGLAGRAAGVGISPLPREHARLARVRAVEKVLDDLVAARHEDLLGPAGTVTG